MSTQVDTRAILRVTAANVVDCGSAADACPDSSGDRMYAAAMGKLAALHEDWLVALAKVRGLPTETESETAAAA